MRSEDPHCKVGATVLSPRGIVLGVGYNGTVAGVDIDWTDRDARRPYVIHAEANALRYVTPHIAAGGIMASTHFPCSACVLLAASYGIVEIAWLYPPDWGRYPADLTESIARRLGVRLHRIDVNA
jgi:dCMP deaminase